MAVQRSLGVEYRHIPVYTTRLVLREMHGMDSVLTVLGTVLTLLCYIPVRTSIKECHTQEGLRSMCVSACENVLFGAGSYAKKQWCIAVLRADSSVDSGPCTLISPGGQQMRGREVKDSLKCEMQRMGCIGARGGDTCVASLPPPTNSYNQNIVTLPRVVDNIGVVYTASADKGAARGLVLNQMFRLPSQCLDVHRMVVYGSPAMQTMRDGFRNLWAKSFQAHQSFQVDGTGSLERIL